MNVKTLTLLAGSVFTGCDSASLPPVPDFPAGQNQICLAQSYAHSHEVQAKNVPVVFARGLEDRKANFAEQIAQLRQGEKEMAELLGQEPGERTKRIFIHNLPRTGGAQYMRESALVFKIHLLSSEQNFKYQAAHEYVHLIDDESDLEQRSSGILSSGRMLAVHSRIKADEQNDFFESLKEQNFLPEAAYLGHPETSPAELVASLVNSLLHPSPEKALEDKSDKFLLYYDLALAALCDNLKQIDTIPETAPVFSKIESIRRLIAVNSEK